MFIGLLASDAAAPYMEGTPGDETVSRRSNLDPPRNQSPFPNYYQRRISYFYNRM